MIGLAPLLCNLQIVLFFFKTFVTFKINVSPGWVGQLVRVLSSYTKIEGPSRSGHIQESTDELINKWNNKSKFHCLPSLSLSKKR